MVVAVLSGGGGGCGEHGVENMVLMVLFNAAVALLTVCVCFRVCPLKEQYGYVL